MQSCDIPSVLITWIQGDIGSSSFSQVISGGGSAWRDHMHEIKCEVFNTKGFKMKWQAINTRRIYAVCKRKSEMKKWFPQLSCINHVSQRHTYLIADLHTHRISCSDNNKVLRVFKTWSHWMRKLVEWNTENKNWYAKGKVTTYCWDSLHTPLQREGLDPLIPIHWSLRP